MLPRASGPTSGWRILVTDDNPRKLYALTEILRNAGHCVFAAYDGESALELVTLLPDLHLLIANTRLGAVDGPELMSRTRALKPTLPILHVGHNQESDNGLPAGVPTLHEPFTPNELLALIGSLII